MVVDMRAARLTLLMCTAATLMSGCNRRPDDVPVIVSAIGPDRLKLTDPSRATPDFPSTILLAATAQGLVRFDALGQIEPGLAERWIVIDDGLSYIFRLRDARWPDGSAVTAGEVVTRLRRAVATGSANPLAPFLTAIDEIVEMTPQVIEVRLKRPRPDLLKLFAQPQMAIFNRRAAGGSGPFGVKPDKGPGVLLAPRTDIAVDGEDSPGSPAPAELVRLRGERAASAIARFVSRRSDLVLGGTFVDWPIVAVANPAPVNIRVDPANGLFGLAIVERKGFLESAENRAAIAMAFDRSGIAQAVRPETQTFETILPEQLDSSAAPNRPSWTSLSADQRLDAARGAVQRWQGTHAGPIELRIALPVGPGATALWNWLAANLTQIGIQPRRVALGADAELRLVDQVAPYDSARWYLETACAPCSTTATAAIQAARDAVAQDERMRRLAEADAAVTADQPFVPLLRPLRWSLVALRLGAWQGNSRAVHPLNHLRNDTR